MLLRLLRRELRLSLMTGENCHVEQPLRSESILPVRAPTSHLFTGISC